MEAKLLITTKDWNKGKKSFISSGTICLWHGATDKEDKLIVAPKNKKGVFHINRHLPKDLFLHN